MGVHVSKWLCTRQPFKILSQIGCRVSTHYCFYTADVPEPFQTIYTAAVCLCKIAIYTAAIQEPNRLYTLLPGVYKKNVIYTAAVKEPNRLYTLLPVVYIKLLFTRQPFKSQLGYRHCCRMYIHEIVIYTAAVQEPTIYIPAMFPDAMNSFHIVLHIYMMQHQVERHQISLAKTDKNAHKRRILCTPC